MMRFITSFLIILALFSLIFTDKEPYYEPPEYIPLYYETFYITQDNIERFNNPDNWSQEEFIKDRKISPGDTVYFSGTFDQPLVVNGDGSENRPITLDGQWQTKFISE